MRHTSDGMSIDYLALGILRHEGNVVLVHQQTPEHAHPYWVLPGGLVEKGELVVDGLIREVQEEAGVQATAIAQLACVTQIDRPEEFSQTIAFIFEIDQWHGDFHINDPDAEIIGVESVSQMEAIARLAANGGWPGIQEPLLAYLRGECKAGAMWFYREGIDGQHLITRIAP